MKSQLPQKILVVFIIAVFIFVLGNLIYNVENLYIGEEVEPVFYQPTQISGGPIASLSTLADAIRYMWYALLGMMILSVIASVYYFFKSKDKKKWRNLLMKIVVGLIIAVVVLGFLLTYNGFDSQNSAGGNSILPGGGGNGGSGSSGGVNQTTTAPTGLQLLISFGIIFLVFGFIVLAGVGAFTFLSMRSGRLAFDKEYLQAKEMAQTVQTAIETLHSGSDAKSTIIRCYNDMCKAMAKHGLADEEHLTPREFEILAEKTLPISKVHLHALVSVFEEARYSAHALSPKESQRAKQCLEKVLDDLVKDDKKAGVKNANAA